MTSNLRARFHSPRVAAVALAALALIADGACKGAERANQNAAGAPSAGRPSTTASAGSVATTGAPAAQAPAPTGAAASTAPKVDPANVKASLKWDAAGKTMTLPVVSGLGRNNGGWNFDGHANGDMTIVVPVGAKVTMQYYNDDIVPHSLGVVPGSPGNVPSAPSAPAFPGAVTTSFQQGLMTNQKDNVVFTADKAGRYLIVCGVPGHGASGMWVVFEVSPSVKEPQIRTKS
jgi:sulfocyanin